MRNIEKLEIGARVRVIAQHWLRGGDAGEVIGFEQRGRITGWYSSISAIRGRHRRRQALARSKRVAEMTDNDVHAHRPHRIDDGTSVRPQSTILVKLPEELLRRGARTANKKRIEQEVTRSETDDALRRSHEELIFAALMIAVLSLGSMSCSDLGGDGARITDSANPMSNAELAASIKRSLDADDQLKIANLQVNAGQGQKIATLFVRWIIIPALQGPGSCQERATRRGNSRPIEITPTEVPSSPNGVALLEFDYLSVRPERRRRAP